MNHSCMVVRLPTLNPNPNLTPTGRFGTARICSRFFSTTTNLRSAQPLPYLQDYEPYPQGCEPFRSRENLAHMRESRPDYGIVFLANVLHAKDREKYIMTFALRSEAVCNNLDSLCS